MKPLFWVSLFCFPWLLQAQNTFVKTIGTTESDFGTACIPTPDMGTLLTVVGGSSTGGVQFSLAKTNHNGTLQWKKVFTHNSFALAQRTIRAADGGYWVWGQVDQPIAPNKALFLLKTDSTGNAEWSRYLPATANDRPMDLIACKSGGFLGCSVANYNSVNALYPSVLLIRFAEDGSVQWTRQYEALYGVEPAAVVELPNGDFAFAAKAKYNLTDPFRHLLVTRTDAQGNVLWNSFFALEYDDEPYDIAADAYGHVYVCGGTPGDAFSWDGFLLKVDAQGQQVFNTLYDAGTTMGEIFRNIAVTPKGDILLLGDMGAFEERDIMLLSVNDQGHIQWVKRYPFSPQFTNYPSDMYTSYNGGIVFTGDVRPPSYLRDAALVRTDSLGNIPCHSESAVFTPYAKPFAASVPLLTVTQPVLPEFDSLVFENLPQPVTEKVMCENPLPVVLNHWSPTLFCPRVCMGFVDSTLNDPTAWYWEFEGAEPATSTQQNPTNICYAEKGTYSVSLTATNAQGTVTQHKKIVIHDTQCPPPVIPNVFTPNGDGTNDAFLIDQLPQEFTFRIYNRWGEEVFLSSEPDHFWKGKNKLGLPVSDGVYFYSLETSDKDYHGFIHLFR